jgi:hypothetical protein
MNKNSIKNLQMLISHLELQKQPKEVLLIIIEIIEKLEGKPIIASIIEKFELVNGSNMSPIDREILEIRIKTFLKEISKKKYEKKVETEN